MKDLQSELVSLKNQTALSQNKNVSSTSNRPEFRSKREEQILSNRDAILIKSLEEKLDNKIKEV
jgi:hypothetical protein